MANETRVTLAFDDDEAAQTWWTRARHVAEDDGVEYARLGWGGCRARVVGVSKTNEDPVVVESPRTEPLGYYALLECDNCDAELYDGVYVSLLTHNGLPVVAVDHATQTRFDCPECGASNYVGDLDVFVEGGTKPGSMANDDVEETE